MSADAPAKIRPACADDREAVQDLLEPEEVEQAFVPSQFLVAETDKAVVGCARCKPLPEGGLELANVVVAPDRRGQGIGRALVHEALADVSEPVHALCLEPEFFERIGFERAQALPPSLAEKATGLCASYEPVAMSWTPED